MLKLKRDINASWIAVPGQEGPNADPHPQPQSAV